MHSIARACSVGITTKCSCGALPNQPPVGDYKWGGCGDDVQYGLAFSETFANPYKDKEDKRKKIMMNKHNTEAGNQVSCGIRSNYSFYKIKNRTHSVYVYFGFLVPFSPLIVVI